MTIRAIARRPGWEPSAVAAELYRLPQILIDNGTHLITYEDYQDTIIFTLDVLSDTTDDRGSGDFYSLDVDVDQNGAVTSNVDVAYGIIGGTADSLCTQYLISANSSTGCGVFASGAVLTSDFTSTPANGTPHIVWELTVPKTELGGGTTADIVVKVHESGVGYTTYPTDNAQATSGLADFGSTLSFSW
jgi:hypothetical protein